MTIVTAPFICTWWVFLRRERTEDGAPPNHYTSQDCAGCRLLSCAFVLGNAKFRLDQPVECVRRLGATQEGSVDEKPRSSIDPGPDSFLDVFFNCRPVLAAGEAGIKLFLIKLQAAGVFNQTVSVELIGAREEEVMVFPKLSLLSCTA